MSTEFNCEYATSLEVQHMCKVAKGPDHGPAPIPEEGKWVQAKQISDISAYTHGVGWCAPSRALASSPSTLRTVLSKKLSLKQSVVPV